MGKLTMQLKHNVVIFLALVIMGTSALTCNKFTRTGGTPTATAAATTQTCTAGMNICMTYSYTQTITNPNDVSQKAKIGNALGMCGLDNAASNCTASKTTVTNAVSAAGPISDWACKQCTTDNCNEVKSVAANSAAKTIAISTIGALFFLLTA